MTPIHHHVSVWQPVDWIDLAFGVSMVLAFVLSCVAVAMDRRGMRG